ncbi:MAG: ABC transporter permease [Candidatus Nanopelagicales bacterium]
MTMRSARSAEAGPRKQGKVRELGLQPLLIAVAGAALYVWVTSHQLDKIELVTLNRDYITTAITAHIRLSFISAAIILCLAVPAGILLTRPRLKFATPFILGIANIGQAFPAVGLVILMGIKFGFGVPIAVAAFTAYGLLPILRNTIVGLQQIDPFVVESARGMGMTARQALFRVEIPLAVPVILAGIRTTLILTVGVATLGVFVNGGGLGTIIVPGLKLGRQTVLVTGGMLTALLAFTLDWLARVAEHVLRPRGI